METIIPKPTYIKGIYICIMHNGKIKTNHVGAINYLLDLFEQYSSETKEDIEKTKKNIISFMNDVVVYEENISEE